MRALRACVRAATRIENWPTDLKKKRKKKKESPSKTSALIIKLLFDISFENSRTKQYRLDDAEFQSSSGIFNLNDRKDGCWSGLSGCAFRKIPEFDRIGPSHNCRTALWKRGLAAWSMRI